MSILFEPKDVNRFWLNVDLDGPIHAVCGRCWVWTGPRNRHGYGRIKCQGITVLVHRLSWEIHCGEIPEGLCVCHKCDVPNCINPTHLFLGTNADNMADRDAKGRHRPSYGDQNGSRLHPECLAHGDDHWSRLHPEMVVKGEKHPCHKLNENEVIAIRALYKEGTYGQVELGKLFEISQGQICRIVNGANWKHIG